MRGAKHAVSETRISMPKPKPGGLVESANLVALLERAGVSKSSLIRVTGPSALSALLWLCRHGYDQVGYIRSDDSGPHEEEPDAILVAHTCNEIVLKRLLALSRRVRPGGVFIFQVRVDRSANPLAVDWLLEKAGFAVEQRLDGGRRALVIARRRTLALRRAA
jgi:hypothetical protein